MKRVVLATVSLLLAVACAPPSPPAPSGEAPVAALTVLTGQEEPIGVSVPAPNVRLVDVVGPDDGLQVRSSITEGTGTDNAEVELTVLASLAASPGPHVLSARFETCLTADCAGGRGSWVQPLEVTVVNAVPADEVDGFSTPDPSRLTDLPNDVQEVRGERVVTLEDAFGPADAESLATAASATIVGGSVDLKAWVFRFASEQDAEAAQPVLQADSSVFAVDYRLLGGGVLADRLPNEYTADVPDVTLTEYSGRNHYFFNEQSSIALEQARSLNLPAAWDIETGSTNVRVGIIDGGLWKGHPDLDPNRRDRTIARVNKQGIFTDGFHGQMVAGNACAKGDNETGLVGSAWNCDLAFIDNSYKHTSKGVETDPGALEKWVDAVARDGGGLDVVNMSFGTYTCDGLSWGDRHGGSLSQGRAKRWTRFFAKYPNTIFVAAVSNCGAEGDKIYGFRKPNGDYLELPSGLAGEVPNLVAVTAVTGENGQYSVTGNVDSAVTTAAPDEWWSTATACKVDRFNLVGLVPIQYDVKGCRHGYATAYGTSFAAPRVSGVVALMRSANRDITPVQVKRCLKISSNSNLSIDGATGFGMLDAAAAVDCGRSGGWSSEPGERVWADVLDEAQIGSLVNWRVAEQTGAYAYLVQQRVGDNRYRHRVEFFEGPRTERRTLVDIPWNTSVSNDGHVGGIALSPDGRTLAVSRTSVPDATRPYDQVEILEIVDTATGQVLDSLSHSYNASLENPRFWTMDISNGASLVVGTGDRGSGASYWWERPTGRVESFTAANYLGYEAPPAQVCADGSGVVHQGTTHMILSDPRTTTTIDLDATTGIAAIGLGRDVLSSTCEFSSLNQAADGNSLAVQHRDGQREHLNLRPAIPGDRALQVAHLSDDGRRIVVGSTRSDTGEYEFWLVHRDDLTRSTRIGGVTSIPVAVSNPGAGSLFGIGSGWQTGYAIGADQFVTSGWVPGTSTRLSITGAF